MHELRVLGIYIGLRRPRVEFSQEGRRGKRCNVNKQDGGGVSWNQFEKMLPRGIVGLRREVQGQKKSCDQRDGHRREKHDFV